MSKISKRTHTIKAYVTEKDFQEITNYALRAGVTTSEFIRRVCLGHSFQKKEDAKQILDLIKVNADMGRIGGLLKQALTLNPSLTYQIRPLLNELLELKEILKVKINKL